MSVTEKESVRQFDQYFGNTEEHHRRGTSAPLCFYNYLDYLDWIVFSLSVSFIVFFITTL